MHSKDCIFSLSSAKSFDDFKHTSENPGINGKKNVKSAHEHIFPAWERDRSFFVRGRKWGN